MEEKEIKEMLKDIIDNGAEYECRHKAEYAFTDWSPYQLGDEVHSDWEYRKVEWYVIGNEKDGYRLTNEKCANIKHCRGTKQECEEWLKQHAKKTWLQVVIAERTDEESVHFVSDYKLGVKDICKKILEETKKMWQEDSDYFSDLKDIIEYLGVEV